MKLLLRSSRHRYFQEMEETNFMEDSQNSHQREELTSQEVKIIEILVNNFKIHILRI